jgi:hypothetical protein
MKISFALLTVILILTLSIQTSPAQIEPETINETLCIPGIVKCTKEGNFICSGDGMSWNPCSGECSKICPETFTPETSIEDYIREVNKGLKDPEEGYGFFGRISGYITNAFNGSTTYTLALACFIIILITLIIYWRRMEG